MRWIRSLCLLFCTIPLAAQPAVIRSLAEMRALTSETVQKRPEALLEGVVTFVNPAKHFVFIQDGRHGSFARLLEGSMQGSLRTGNRVRIAGFVDPGGYTPGLHVREITILGDAPLPLPIPATASEIDRSHYENQRIVVKGIVRSAGLAGETAWPNSVVMLLESEGRRWRMRIPEMRPANVSHFQNATIRAIAVTGSIGNSSGQMVERIFYVRSLSDIAIDAGPTVSPPPPRVAAANLLQYGGPALAGEAVAVRGVVTAIVPGAGIFLQDGDTGVFLESLQEADVRPGDEILGQGRVAIGDRRPFLRDAFWTVLASGKPPVKPHPITGAQLGLDEHDGRAISIEAIFEGDNRRSRLRSRIVLDLRCPDGYRFDAYSEDLSAPEPPAFEIGSRLRVTGVLRGDPDPLSRSRRNYHILIAGPRSLELISSPSWWSSRRIAVVLGVVSALGILSLIWVYTLRIRVRRQTSELRAAKEAAEAAHAVKAQFLAHISHEIRTPMNGVIGMIELGRRTATDPATSEYLATAGESAYDLLGLLNDVLDLSKIEAGKLDVERIPFSLHALLTNVERLFAHRASGKGVSLQLEISPQIPPWSVGDPVRLRQVLHNLTANAINFTHAGSVRIRAFPSNGRIEIEVEDTGIGIPASQLESIFLPFEQADSSITRRYGGTGLGLAIASKLVAAMGGTLAVISRDGHGSRFHFALDLPRAERAPESHDAIDEPTTPHPLKILVAEDNRVNLTVARRLLELQGHTVITASNGRLAVERWLAEKPDLILMDIQMPEMDGLTATARIRAEEAAGVRVPIIALTAHALDGYSDRTAHAGMDIFLTKPIREADLLRAIHQLTSRPVS